MTNTLQRFDQDGIEIVIDTETGESFASIRGYARMSGKHESTIRSRLKSARIDSAKTAVIQTGRGNQAARLIPEDLIVEWLPKDNPEMASKLMRLGVRMFMHQMAGYNVTSSAIVSPALPQNYIEALEALLESEKQKQILLAEQKMLEAENAHLSEMVDELYQYSSIVRIAKFNNVSEKTFRWQSLKAMSLSMGLEVKKVPCPRFESKNLYHHDVWRFLSPKYKLPETTTLTVSQNGEVSHAV